MRQGQTLRGIKIAIRSKYAWPGGYPMILVMSDGAALCMDCARKEWRNIYRSTKNRLRDGWRAEGGSVNYENPGGEELCEVCGKILEAAYESEGNDDDN